RRTTDARSAHPAGHPGGRQHARLRQEPESRGDHDPRGVPRDLASNWAGARTRCVAHRRSQNKRRCRLLRLKVPMPHLVHTTIGIPATVAVALAAFTYTRGWLHIRRGFPNTIPTHRLGAFMFGLLTVWVAVGSPLTALHHELLTAHMAQHI